MKTKNFKPFDKVLVRDHEEVWQPDLYGFWDKCRDRHQTMMNNSIADEDILFYEGNEYLIGTTDGPVEVMKLEVGESIICNNDAKLLADGVGFLTTFSYVNDSYFYTGKGKFVNEEYNYCIRFSDFQPGNKEEMSKNILRAKEGKITRYKNKEI